MATPYGESKGGLWPSLNARRRSAALAAGEERIYARAGRLSPSCPSLVPFLGKQERNSLSVDYRQTAPLDVRQIQAHPGAGPGKLRRSLSGRNKKAPA